MNFEIAGKTAVVTAGSLGIGKATALSLAKEGANVAICGRDKGNLEAAVKDIQSQVDVNIFTLRCGRYRCIANTAFYF